MESSLSTPSKDVETTKKPKVNLSLTQIMKILGTNSPTEALAAAKQLAKAKAALPLLGMHYNNIFQSIQKKSLDELYFNALQLAPMHTLYTRSYFKRLLQQYMPPCHKPPPSPKMVMKPWASPLTPNTNSVATPKARAMKKNLSALTKLHSIFKVLLFVL